MAKAGEGMRRSAAAALVAIAALIAMPASAFAGGPAWSVTIFSERGDPLGDGVQHVFHEGDVELRGGATARQIIIGLGPDGPGWELRFAPPSGQDLAPGVYEGAMREGFEEPGHPTMDVQGNWSGCNELSGRFEIKELAYGEDGQADRLWMTFEQHCGYWEPATFGEIRIGMPSQTGAGGPAAGRIEWPTTEVDRSSEGLPVEFVAGQPAAIERVAIEGSETDKFPIVYDGCSGLNLAAGDGCSVWLKPQPQSEPGDISAVLRFVESGDVAHDVPLSLRVEPTLTAAEFAGEPGDPMVGDRAVTWSPEDHEVRAEEYGRNAGLTYQYQGHTFGIVLFGVPAGSTLAPGRYTGAVLPDWTVPGSSLEVQLGGYECRSVTGAFTIHEIEFSPWRLADNWSMLDALNMTFVQRCDGAPGVLRGSIRLHASDTSPWVPEELPADEDMTPPPSDEEDSPAPRTDQAAPPPPIAIPTPAKPTSQATRRPALSDVSFARLSAHHASGRLTLTASDAGKIRGSIFSCGPRRPGGPRCAGALAAARLDLDVPRGTSTLPIRALTRRRPGRYRIAFRLTAADGRQSQHVSVEYRVT